MGMGINELLAGEFMKTDHQKSVEEFMYRAKQDVPYFPAIPDEKTRLRQARLIMEESIELIESLGIGISVGGARITKDNFSSNALDDRRPIDLSEVAKEVADLHVVATGAASACGIRMKPIQEAVDKSNLEKFGPGSYTDVHGKLIKPPDWQRPDIESLLDKQRPK